MTTATAGVVEVPTGEQQAPVEQQTQDAAPLRLNASGIERLRALFGESDIRKMDKAELERKLIQCNEQVLASQEGTNEKIGALVAVLAEYWRKHKPSYKDVAALILTSDAKHSIGTRKRIFQAAKGLPEERIKQGANPYRQFATRYVRLAKWTLGEFTKEQMPVDHVEINSVAYFTPVDALLAGYSMHCVENAWKWATTPRSSGQDLRQLKSRPTVDVAMARVDKITVPVRKLNADKTAEDQKMVKVVEHPAAIYGTILGLLNAAKSRFEKDGEALFSHEQGSTLIEMVESLTEQSEPAQ